MNVLLDLSIFKRNRNFTLLYIARFIAFIGTMMTSVALPYQVYMQTRSTLMVGLLSLVQLLPLLATALIGGVFADRYHRRFLLIASEAVLALGSLMLALNAYRAHPSLAVIFCLAAFMSAFNGIHRPALDSIRQQIVAKKDFPVTSSLYTFQGSVCMIVGPAIGGLVIAHYGIKTTYFIDFMTFLISVGCLLAMTTIPKPELNETDESTFASIKVGIKYAFSKQELMGSYYVDFVAMIFGMPTALFPALAMTLGGPSTVGLLYAAPALGAVIIAVFSGWTAHFKYHGRAIAYAAIGWGIAIVAFGLVKELYLVLFFLSIAGACDAVSGMYRGVLWNETIPNALRGRLAGIEMISYLSGPRLGDTEAGLVASAFGITASIVSGGVLCILGVGIGCYFLPKFWHYQAKAMDAEISGLGTL